MASSSLMKVVHSFIHSFVDTRLETIYSFIGNFSPSQDTDCMKQDVIKNVHDPAEIYRQSIQNSLIATAEDIKEIQPQKQSRTGFFTVNDSQTFSRVQGSSHSPPFHFVWWF